MLILRNCVGLTRLGNGIVRKYCSTTLSKHRTSWINTSHLAVFQQKRPSTRKAWFLPTEAWLGEPRCRRYLIPSARARSSIILQPSGGPRTLPPLYRVQLPRAACSIPFLLCFWYGYLHFLIPMSGELTFAKKKNKSPRGNVPETTVS